MRYRYWLMPLALVIALASNATLTTAARDTQPISQLRVVHALPGIAPVDVFIDGARSVTGLSFGAATPYINLPTGSHAFAVVPAGALVASALISSQADLAPGQPYTLMAAGASPAGFMLEDTRFTPIGGSPRARFIHASPNLANVDIAVEGGSILFSNIALGQATPYVELPAGTATLVVRQAGTETSVLAIPDLVLAINTVYTFAVIGLLGNTPALSALPLIDS